MTNYTREHPASLRVICLGLGRTGTFSLATALETLGFGPCHHPAFLGIDSDFWGRFAKVVKHNPTPEVLDELYCGYGVALDNTAAVIAEQLYRAYPEAKFILTTRNPAKWVQSMQKTVIQVYIDNKARAARIASGTSTEIDRILSEKMNELGMIEWAEVYGDWYHQGRLMTDPEGEFERHNRHIMQLIPPEKLLVFDVSEGWKPLVKFLGVPEPSESFPCLNDPAGFFKRGDEWFEKIIQASRLQADTSPIIMRFGI